MRFGSYLGRLGRRALLGVLAALLVVEGGLLYLGWLALRPGSPAGGAPRSAVVAPTPAVGVTAGPTAQAGQEGVAARAVPSWLREADRVPRERPGAVEVGDPAALARLFDAEEALAHAAALAAPEFGGRQPGTPRHAAAGDYIAERYAEYGLLPAGTDGYYQPFTVPFARVTAVPALSVATASGGVREDFAFREDYAHAWGGYAGGGAADGRVHWLSDGAREDYRGLDVTDGIVFCRHTDSAEALRQAALHGAVGMLLFVDDAGPRSLITTLRTYREPPYLPESLPVLLVGERVAEALLEGSGYTPSDLSILYEPIALDAVARFEVPMDEPGVATARNVLGVLPGADPELATEAVILGAHYDHLGTDANGDVYCGANDDASGVAVLLEIARSWQAAGFQPARSVIFAAWDAEEQGLLGARHYVEQPMLPLEQTVGMIQLDMVGLATEGLLTVGGPEGDLSRQLLLSAEVFGLRASDGRTGALGGTSDHAAFAAAGVDAALITWDGAGVPHYHTPQDTVETLQPERLRLAGAVASHAAVALSDTAVHVGALLEVQAAAIRAGDVDGYLATLDPEDDALRRAAPGWLAARREAVSGGLEVAARSFLVGDGTAYATVSARVGGGEGTPAATAEYPARFVHRAGAWYGASSSLREERTGRLTLRLVEPWAAPPPPDAADQPDAWLAGLDAAYGEVAALLGHAPAVPVAVTVYPTASAARWLAPVAAWSADAPLPAGHVGRTVDASSVALRVFLEGMGLPAGEGAWLRAGLESWIAARTGTSDGPAPAALRVEDLPADADALATLTAQGDLTAAEGATAASLVEYLLHHHGPAGLRALCGAWGTAGDLDGAFVALGTDAAAFAREWHDAVLAESLRAQEGIARTLEARREALATGDLDGFMETVAPGDATLLAEEAAWFRRVRAAQGRDVEYRAHVVALVEGEAVARVTGVLSVGPAGSDPLQVQGEVRFRRVGGEWLWAGGDLEALREGDLTLLRPPGVPPDVAGAHLAAARRAYERVTEDLGRRPSAGVIVRLHATAAEAEWARLAPPGGGWAPGDAIHLAADGAPAGSAREVARALTHALLGEMDVDAPWVAEGLALLEVQRCDPEGAWAVEAEYLGAAREAVRFGRAAPWEAASPDGAGRAPGQSPSAGSEQALREATGQAWLAWERLAARAGMAGVRAALGCLAAGDDWPAAVLAATGEPFAEWEAAWRQEVLDGLVSPGALGVARGFAVERALETVRLLSSPAHMGRLAGGAGALAAAHHIAGEMEALGLRGAAPDGSFFHRLRVPVAQPADVPSLAVRAADGAGERVLSYPADFVDLVGGHAGGGRLRAEMVWIPGDYGAGFDLGGRIALKRAALDAAEEALAAAEHGAGGLILVERQLGARVREVPDVAMERGAIPVARIDEATWREFLALAGMTTRDALDAPQALILPLEAELAIPYEPPRTGVALTVMGCLPGSDADGAPVVVVAHYDGVGMLPDGTLYPGANENASGVATLLEVARLLAAHDEPPRRSVCIVALGAEEVGLASVRALLDEGEGSDLIRGAAGVLVLDRLAQARSYYLNIDADGAREGELLHALTLAGELLDRRVSRGTFREENTHVPLRDLGVPAALAFWPDAAHVHTPQDTPESLDPYKLATSGEVVALALLMMGW